jgi:curli production assembly/transport component CsgG
VASNEPTQIAVQAAVEKAVYALILEGAKPGPRQLWSFADAAAGQSWLDRYNEDRQRSIAAAFKDGGPPVAIPSSKSQ